MWGYTVVMQISQFLTSKIQEVISKPDLKVEVEVPEERFGDYSTNIAMVLGKSQGRSPTDEAAEIVRKLESDNEVKKIFESIQVVKPGFINLKLSTACLLQNLDDINADPSAFGSAHGKKQAVLVEYFQLNAAKPPHVGHLRSAFIGDSLKRLFISQGYKTVSDTHIGDWGTQFGLLLWAYKNFQGREKVKDNPLVRLNELYIGANIAAEKSPDIKDQAKSEFAILERGDKENRKLWEFFVSVTIREIKKAASELKLLPFDYNFGESYYREGMKKILESLEKARLLQIGETGERYVDLEAWGLGRLICIKSDGASTYELRDLATLAFRYDELSKKLKLPLSLNLYVVDTRQAHDFKQVFKTMELLGYDTSKSVHVDFGFVSLPEGVISTRAGKVIYLEELLAEARNRALKIIDDKNPNLKHKEKIASMVGLAALKYTNLAPNRRSDITFSWEESLNFEGNTGPYLQYTYARLRSILRKSNQRLGGKRVQVAMDEPERTLARRLVYFPEVVARASQTFMPSVLTMYLYELAAEANNFYHSTPVLQEADKEKRSFRLSLVSASADVLKNGLYLLGIDSPDEM